MLLIREWAGRERKFVLTFGSVMDLEQACGDGKEPAAVGAIFQRLVSSKFRAGDVYHTIRMALIGGGMGQIEAKTLLAQHFDTRPYLENAGLAIDILTELMAGVEPAPKVEDGDGEAQPIKFSEAVQICQIFHMSPLDLRGMSYADFINLVRGFNAGSKRQADYMSEDEFMEILAKYEPEALNGPDS